MEVKALICRFSQEETPQAEGATIVVFDVEEYATRVNALLSTMGTRPVLLMDRCHMEPGWMEPMLEEMAVTGGIVSPWFRTGVKAIKWYDQILPSAFMAPADVLYHLGGLNQEMLFCQARVIEHRARHHHIQMTSAEGAVATPAYTPDQAARAGALYYRQIEDERRAQQIMGGS